MTVNFTNILQAAFYFQSSLRTFYVLTIMFVIFWQKDFGAKAAHKMLVKLTPGGCMGSMCCNFFLAKITKLIIIEATVKISTDLESL
jgi:hypothetical protein